MTVALQGTCGHTLPLSFITNELEINWSTFDRTSFDNYRLVIQSKILTNFLLNCVNEKENDPTLEYIFLFLWILFLGVVSVLDPKSFF